MGEMIPLDGIILIIMKNILVIGAGRSTGSLIRYLLAHAQSNDWSVTVADRDERLIHGKDQRPAEGQGFGPGCGG